jgi:ligand-binding SRPBCC domain-containing protein
VYIHRLHAVQHLAVRLDEAWGFFTDPRNLALLTPPDMRFTLTSPTPAEVYQGLILTYRLTPLLGLPASWVTEITHIEPMRRFVDEQRAGPYRLWHHEHRFASVPGGTAITDEVWYALPLGLVGEFAHRTLVRARLRAIFAFRREVLATRFGELASSPGRSGQLARLVRPEASLREAAWNTPSRR